MSTLSVQSITGVTSFDFSNTTFANAYNVANSGYVVANSGFGVANGAFGKANSALQNTSTTLSGSLTTTGTVTSTYFQLTDTNTGRLRIAGGGKDLLQLGADSAGLTRVYVGMGALNSALGSSTYWTSGGDTVFINGTSGNEGMKLDSTGDLGIGTSPLNGYRLSVVDGNQTVISAYTTATPGNSGFAALRLGDTTGTDRWQVQHDASSNSFNIYDFTSSSNRLRIDSAGNLGIGTTSPSTYGRFGVVGGEMGISNTNDARLYLYTGTTSRALFYADTGRVQLEALSSLPLVFWTSSSERMRIDTTGRVTKPYQPSFVAYGGSYPGAGSEVVWSSTTINVGSSYNTSTGRFTAPVAGYYMVGCQAFINTTGYTQLNCNINNSGGVFEIKTNFAEGGYTSHCASKIIYLNVNDYISVKSSGGSILVGSDYSWFYAYLLG